MAATTHVAVKGPVSDRLLASILYAPSASGRTVMIASGMIASGGLQALGMRRCKASVIP
jgi:hypothetical protein